MASAALWVAAGAVAAGTLAWVVARHARPSTPFYRPGRIALIGDSLGVGLYPALRPLLAARGIQLDGLAVGATHTGQWLGSPHRAKLESALDQGAYAVLVSLGTNDCYLEGPYCKAFPERILALVKAIQARGAVPVLLSPGALPWSSSRGQAMESALQSAAAAAGAIYIPGGPYPKADGIHYSSAGNIQWAEAIDALLAARTL